MFPSHDSALLHRTAQALSQSTGALVHIVAHTHSTNQVLLNEAASLTEQATVLMALAQSAGRGRRGRAWQDAASTGSNNPAPAFLGSLGIVSHAPLAALSLLPLYVGVATARCLQGWGVPAQVKWPNDIWIEGAKLAGILVETAPMPASLSSPQATAVVIGLGLNWTAAPQVVGKAVTCVADCIATRPAPEQAAQDLIWALRRAYDDCIHGEPLEFASFDALLGLTIRTDAGVEGRAVGINAQGHLGLQTLQAVHWLHSGEVSVALKGQP